MKRHLLLTALALLTAVAAMAGSKIPEWGVYKIQNVYSGTYVKLQGTYLADITARTPEDASDILVEYGKRDANGEALLTELSGDGGDMIETLNFIKGQIKGLLERRGYATDYLEEMFQLHLVPTGDADGSVFLCVDVPAIDNWDEIKSVILTAAGGQSAITYYISHMYPGNRHYMAIDPDGSFGYRLQAGTTEGTDIKWLMYSAEYPASAYYFMRNLASQQYINVTAEDYVAPSLAAGDHHVKAGAVIKFTFDGAGAITAARSQGVEAMAAIEAIKPLLAPFASSFTSDADAIADFVNDCYVRLCRTNERVDLNSSAKKFDYDAFYVKLHMPSVAGLNGATNMWPLTKKSMLDKVAQELGSDSRIYQALAARADLLEPNADLLLVQDEDGTLGLVGVDEVTPAAKWQIDLIDTEDNYFAAAPEIAANGKYYTTLYTDFPYAIVNPDNVKAYAVSSVTGDGEPTLVDLGTTVPAQTGVVIECATTDALDNLLLPVADNSAAPAPLRAEGTSSNMLQGTFFDGVVANNGNDMAVLSQGLKFAVSNDAYMPGNKAWLTLPPKTPTAIDRVEAAEQNADAPIYDLMGRRVLNPGHGIYIVAGKKVAF